MTTRRRFWLTSCLLLGPAALAACDLLLTDPAPSSREIAVSFQVEATTVGASAAAFSRVRRVALRFFTQDAVFRDTVVAILPVGGVATARIVLEPKERIDALRIEAQLGYGTAVLYEGSAIVVIVPGDPTTAEIPVLPVPDRIEADRDLLLIPGSGAVTQLSAAVLFVSGDTIRGFEGVWSSEDPTIVAVTPFGLAMAQRMGSTRLEVRYGTLTDTVRVDVLGPV